jgi:ABC-type branched-subunit amino acid transport system substrate-binding protein
MRRLLRVLAALAIVVAAGCGGDDNKKSGSSAAAGDKPFRIMVVTGINTQVNNLPTLPDAARAAADSINKSGGLGGRPIEIEACNMQGTAAGQAACARKAVTEKVDDVIQNGCCSVASNPILDAGKVPQVGGFPVSTADFASPNMVPVVGGPALSFACMPLQAKRQGVKRLAVELVDVEVSHYLDGIIKDASGRAGIEHIGSVSAPLNETDYSPEVQKLKKLGPDGVGFILTPAGGLGTFRAMQQQGLDVPKFEITNTWGDDEIKPMGKVAEGLHGCSSVPPQSAMQLPAIQQMHKEFDAGGVSNRGPGNIQIWLSMHGIAALSKKVDGEVNGKSLLDAAHKATDVDVLGLFKWNPGRKGPAGFEILPDGLSWLVVNNGGRWELEEDQPVHVWKELGQAPQ